MTLPITFHKPRNPDYDVLFQLDTKAFNRDFDTAFKNKEELKKTPARFNY